MLIRAYQWEVIYLLALRAEILLIFDHAYPALFLSSPKSIASRYRSLRSPAILTLRVSVIVRGTLYLLALCAEILLILFSSFHSLCVLRNQLPYAIARNARPLSYGMRRYTYHRRIIDKS